MTHEEKIEAVKAVLKLTDAEIKLMIQADQHDERLDKLVKLAKEQTDDQIDSALLMTDYY
ncbi:MAG: hypothetical protein ABF723_05220 [Lentilactobacillus hilgardii]|uniref:hypothetical protein n=1 Tax=Lentilactobacillus hilgardii TaxID=1588 RepID=UPI0039EB34D4